MPDRSFVTLTGHITCYRHRYAWQLDKVLAVARTVPYRGRQGLFTVPNEVVA